MLNVVKPETGAVIMEGIDEEITMMMRMSDELAEERMPQMVDTI